jgi:WD40 repeat protein
MTLKVHKNAVRGIAWLNGNILVSGGDDGRIVVWDLAKEEPRQIRVEMFSSSIKGLAFLTESQELVCGHKDGTVRVLELPSLSTLRKRHLGSRILAVRSQAKEPVLAVSAVGKKVFLLDRELRVVQNFPPPDREIYSLAFSPDHRQLAGGGWFKIFLWDLSSGTLEEWDTHHFGKIPSLDYSPDGKEIASIGRISDSKIFLTLSASGQPSRHLLRHSLCGTALRFSPDGRYIASTSDDQSVRIYDLTEPYPPR